MSVRERIFHSMLFELVALLIVVPVSSYVTGHSAGSMTKVLIGVSVLAMIWNYLFNLGFDRMFGHNRIERGWGMRIMHGISFEAGLLFVTIPFLMWQLNQSFMYVLIMDIAFVIFFLIYAMVYNFIYDHVRAYLINRTQSCPHT